MSHLHPLREKIRARYRQTEPEIVRELLSEIGLNSRERFMLRETAAATVTELRQKNDPSIMESFLGEYGLSTKEGIGLMCLAEALLRVPDATTIDELIADKIEPSNWGLHLGQSSSSLVNASTWALLLTGQLLDDGAGDHHLHPVTALRSLIKRLGEPVVRTAVSQAMKFLGKQFVLGQTIEEAVSEAAELESQGYTYSYDMLGEAARTANDAERYFQAYAHAIKQISNNTGDDIISKPGISIKLSALHPRYEYTHKQTVMDELLPKAQALVDLAADANIGLNIDAEEADRLDLSLDLIESLMANTAHKQWRGFGVVVQSYGRRALPVIDWLIERCHHYNTHIMVRLVKGAYWDAEIKQAQELGLANFPVFTRKAHTDVSYIVCAQRLLNNRDVIYPQFATHNAHTVSTIRYLAGPETDSYEFQRLHGMGEALHQHIKQQHNTRCRIYAPVGAHVDLLAYLVRRLLENGANSSFVNQIVNTDISAMDVARCPIEETHSFVNTEHPAIKKPLDLFKPERVNSKGYRINDPASIQPLLDARDTFKSRKWTARTIAGRKSSQSQAQQILNPANSDDVVGTVHEALVEDVTEAVSTAIAKQSIWQHTDQSHRSACLMRAADLYEDNIAELCALTCREAGKHLLDGISEVREAVDFLRYYACQAQQTHNSTQARGVIACISPWNFPLAIFSGQIAAALVVGNSVIAKPAEQTPLIAARAVELMHAAGIPLEALQLLPGNGADIGNALISDKRIDGVCFTGSTGVAKHIELTLANRTCLEVESGASTDPMLIAETGGLNAMIADTTALTEQVVRDVVMSAFQSAGQRCSALRILYIQEEAQDRLLTMLAGALDTLNVGDPWSVHTDVGPVIDTQAQTKINNYIEKQRHDGKVIKQIPIPDEGSFCSPTIVRVNGIEDMDEEIFGPVLHVASYKSSELDQVIKNINAAGYGLTFGLHTRIDDRVQSIVDRVNAGNIYVNRNQIGAIVGSQPFGGEGLSGTGPKAGGPHYLSRFIRPEPSIRTTDKRSTDSTLEPTLKANTASSLDIQDALNTLKPSLNTIQEWILPGPTGESNRLTLHPHQRVLIIGGDSKECEAFAAKAIEYGCAALVVCENRMNNKRSDTDQYKEIIAKFDLNCLSTINNIDAVAISGTTESHLQARAALANRAGPIVPLITQLNDTHRFTIERHVCIDTTAAGGNASLLASTE